MRRRNSLYPDTCRHFLLDLLWIALAAHIFRSSNMSLVDVTQEFFMVDWHLAGRI